MRTGRPKAILNAVQRRTHASFGHNAVVLAARGTDVAGELARPMLRGVEKLGLKFTLTMAPKLIAAQA